MYFMKGPQMKMTQPLSSMELRKQNRNRVYRTILDRRAVTKQELAQLLTMSMPTVTQNLRELAEAGLIDDSETTESTGGRRPHLLTPVYGARFSVGAAMSASHLHLVAVDLGQNIKASLLVAQKFSNTPEFGRKLLSRIESFLDENELERERLLGIGLAIPGLISADGGQIEYAPTFGIREGEPTVFTAQLPYRFHLDNDATSGGFAEWSGRDGQRDMAFLSLSRGVGGAILSGGRMVTGEHNYAAEFGHMCIHPGGKQCSCGRCGCLEAYCSAQRLTDDLGVNPTEFRERLAQGDPAVTRVWDEYLDNLVIAVGNIHTMLDCDVVIGGVASQFLPPYMGELRARLRRANPLPPTADYVQLCRFEAKSSAMGAAMYFTENFISEV